MAPFLRAPRAPTMLYGLKRSPAPKNNVRAARTMFKAAKQAARPPNNVQAQKTMSEGDFVWKNVAGAGKSRPALRNSSAVPDDPARIPRRDHIPRQIPSHHAAGPHHCIGTDRHAWTENRAPADPGIVPHGHRQREFEPGPPSLRIGRMLRRVDLYSRPDLHASPIVIRLQSRKTQS